MKKINRYVSLFCLSIICFLSLGYFASCSQRQRLDYVGYLGKTFTFPITARAEFEITAPNGGSVDIVGQSFTPETVGVYKYTAKYNGSKYEGNISVQDCTPPTVYTEFAFKYVLKDTAVQFPWITVRDYNQQQVDVKMSLIKGENVIAYENNVFQATELGDYKLTVEAVDEYGNQTVKEVIFNVTENEELLSSITAFEHEYGKRHICRRHAFEPSYSTQFKHGKENGSLKLRFTTDTFYEGWIFLDNLLISDISESKGLYFYVYNDSSTPKKLYLNRSTNITLVAREWTEIRITDYTTFIGNAGYNATKENFSLQDINGMFIYMNETNSNIEFQDFYVSNIYMIK